MKTTIKRFISLLLVLVMVVGILPASAFATEAVAEETVAAESTDPTVDTTAPELSSAEPSAANDPEPTDTSAPLESESTEPPVETEPEYTEGSESTEPTEEATDPTEITEQTEAVEATEPSDGATSIDATEPAEVIEETTEVTENTEPTGPVSDPTADIESEAEWEASFSSAALTGNKVADLIAIAKSQLGYSESKKNFIVDENGNLDGYTRYGDWYGIPYGDWCAMFVSFCLYYSGIEIIPLEASCQTWINIMKSAAIPAWYDADDEAYSPVAGDIIFFDLNGDGRSDHVGIIAEVLEDGSYKVYEGNYDDRVALVDRAHNRTVLGYIPVSSLTGYSAVATTAVAAKSAYSLPWIGRASVRYNFTYSDALGASHSGWFYGIRPHTIDGKQAYCVQPTHEFGTTYTQDEATAAWKSQLTTNQKRAIALAVAYGYPNSTHANASTVGAAEDQVKYDKGTTVSGWQETEKIVATQIIVWEIVMGKRSAAAPYTCTDSSLINAFYSTSRPYGDRADWNTLKKTYDTISANMAKHGLIPSFSSRSNADDQIPTYKLTLDASGNYTVTLTDTNNVLEDYNFSFGNGITCTRSGNKLTITATPAAAQSLASTPVSTSATGHSLNIDTDKVLLVWEEASGGQTVVTLNGSTDPLQAYFRLTNEPETGKLSVHKNTNTGKNLEGWIFTIYSDAECTQVVGTMESDKTGLATSDNLLPGVYYVRETGHVDGLYDDEYWQCSTIKPSITVVAGKTTELTSYTFENTQYGKAQITKSLEAEGPLEGWQFKVMDSTGAEVEGSPFSTDETGTVITGLLLPGTYTVEEIIPENSIYYCKSENPQTVTIVEGEIAEVSFVNAFRPGKIAIEKVDLLGNHLAGAKFCLEWSEDGTTWTPVIYSDQEDLVKGGCSTEGLDANGYLVTGSDGMITFEGLYPTLQYRVSEVEAPNGYLLLTDYAFIGELPAEDLTVSMTVVNSPVFELPQSGSNELTHTVSLGTVLLLTGLCICMAVVTTPAKSKRDETE